MKKLSLAILLGGLMSLTLAASALAATGVSFSPTNVSVKQGQTFTLTIGVNPQGVKNYTVKTELRFPADLLEVKSFSFANGWMPLSQTGYDLTDNTNGVLLKTAGYPGGLSAATTFGTVSFQAKKSGNGTISLSGNSMALDANNQNVLSGGAQTAVAVSATVTTPTPVTPTPTPTTPATPTTPSGSTTPGTEQPAVQEIEGTVLGEETEQTGETPEPPAETQPEASQSSLLASIAGLGLGKALIGLLIIAALYALYTVLKKRKQNS